LGPAAKIYVARKGSAAIERVEEVRAVAGGIEGDRYEEGTGYWTPYE
jgi:hypothetical protein